MRRAFLLFVFLVGTLVHGGDARAQTHFREYEPPRAPSFRFDASDVAVTLVERGAARTPYFDSELEEGVRRDPQPDTPETVSRELVTEVLIQRARRCLNEKPGRVSLEVTLLELDGRVSVPDKSWEEHVCRAKVLVRVLGREGHPLVVAEGNSSLRGRLGGMMQGIRKGLSAAIIDAFERVVLRDEFVAAVNVALASAGNDEVPADARGPVTLRPVANAWKVAEHKLSASYHQAGVVFDAGSAYSFGLRYLHNHLFTQHGLLFLSYGAEALLFMDDAKGVDAAGALALVRLGGGVEMGSVLELGAGVARGERTTGVITLGGYIPGIIVDLGVTAQIPLAVPRRPDWLSVIAFGLRVDLPFARSSLAAKRNSPLPLTVGELPSLYGFDDGKSFDPRPCGQRVTDRARCGE